MQTLNVHDWDVHQTYRKDRGQPPWIKIHRTIIRHHKWAALSDAERGQLVAIWILAADDDGKIPNDARLVRKLCYMDEEPDLQRFVSLGFLDDDGTMASARRHDDVTVTPERRQDDAPEKRREEEKRIEYTLEFEAVWNIHRKGPKSKAAESYRKALKRTDADTITNALKAYTSTLRPPEFTGQHLHRWLDQDRWEEVQAPSADDARAHLERQLRLIHG
jgi:hypothetical protein